MHMRAVIYLNPLPAKSPQARKMLRLAPPLAGAGANALRRLCTTATPSKPPPEPLSPSDLDAISALLPLLISDGRAPAAGCLLLPGSQERLPFYPLAAHLASMPTLTPAFALLTAIRPSPPRSSPPPPHMHCARAAASVLRCLCRPDSKHRPDSATYAVAVAGLRRLEDPKNALVTLRELAADGFRPSWNLREAARDAMLQDARIEEAWALEEEILRPESGKLVELVDKLLGEWGVPSP